MRISDIILVVLLLIASAVVGWEVVQFITLPSQAEDTINALSKTVQLSPGTQQELELHFSSARRSVRIIKELIDGELVGLRHAEEDLAQLVAARELEAKKAISDLRTHQTAEAHNEVQLDKGFGERMSLVSGSLEAFEELASLEELIGGRVEGLDPFKGYSGTTWASQTISVVKNIADRVVSLRKKCAIEHIDSQFRGILRMWPRNFRPDFSPIYQPTFASDAKFHSTHEAGLADHRK